jgi:hypothetical protein
VALNKPGAAKAEAFPLNAPSAPNEDAVAGPKAVSVSGSITLEIICWLLALNPVTELTAQETGTEAKQTLARAGEATNPANDTKEHPKSVADKIRCNLIFILRY